MRKPKLNEAQQLFNRLAIMMMGPKHDRFDLMQACGQFRRPRSGKHHYGKMRAVQHLQRARMRRFKKHPEDAVRKSERPYNAEDHYIAFGTICRATRDKQMKRLFGR